MSIRNLFLLESLVSSELKPSPRTEALGSVFYDRSKAVSHRLQGIMRDEQEAGLGGMRCVGRVGVGY